MHSKLDDTRERSDKVVTLHFSFMDYHRDYDLFSLQNMTREKRWRWRETDVVIGPHKSIGNKRRSSREERVSFLLASLHCEVEGVAAVSEQFCPNALSSGFFPPILSSMQVVLLFFPNPFISGSGEEKTGHTFSCMFNCDLLCVSSSFLLKGNTNEVLNEHPIVLPIVWF